MFIQEDCVGGNQVVFSINSLGCCFCMESDSEYDESGYGFPSRALLKRNRQAYEEAEREDGEDGKCNGSDHPEQGNDILQL